jgi:hypothetical protein
MDHENARPRITLEHLLAELTWARLESTDRVAAASFVRQAVEEALAAPGPLRAFVGAVLVAAIEQTLPRAAELAGYPAIQDAEPDPDVTACVESVLGPVFGVRTADGCTVGDMAGALRALVAGGE